MDIWEEDTKEIVIGTDKTTKGSKFDYPEDEEDEIPWDTEWPEDKKLEYVNGKYLRR